MGSFSTQSFYAWKNNSKLNKKKTICVRKTKIIDLIIIIYYYDYYIVYDVTELIIKPIENIMMKIICGNFDANKTK